MAKYTIDVTYCKDAETKQHTSTVETVNWQAAMDRMLAEVAAFEMLHPGWRATAQNLTAQEYAEGPQA